MEQDINFLEFSTALNSLKGQTPAQDKINYPMIQHVANPVKMRIINFFNSILKSHIPQTYKSSIIIPIHKPGTDKTLTESYRPISLNPCMSKTLDKIISKRLWWFATSNKLLNSRHLGFKKGKSAMDCLLYADALINRALNEKRHLSIISLDFAKAFEKIGLHTIINQLSAWGCGPTTYVSHFMSNRKIRVRANNTTSTVQRHTARIPTLGYTFSYRIQQPLRYYRQSQKPFPHSIRR